MDREGKLQAEADDGLRIRAMLDDGVVISFFQQQTEMLTAEMLGASVDDDLTRRNAAIKLNMLNELRTHLVNAVTRGDRAVSALEKIRTKAHA